MVLLEDLMSHSVPTATGSHECVDYRNRFYHYEGYGRESALRCISQVPCGCAPRLHLLRAAAMLTQRYATALPTSSKDILKDINASLGWFPA